MQRLIQRIMPCFIALLCGTQILTVYAATMQPTGQAFSIHSESTTFDLDDDLSKQAELQSNNEILDLNDPPNPPPLASGQTKKVSGLTSFNPFSDQASYLVQYNPVYSGINTSRPPSYNEIIRHSYSTLNNVIDDEILDDAVLIMLDFNKKLNQLNQEVNRRMSPAVEELFVMQNLFSDSGVSHLFSPDRSNPYWAPVSMPDSYPRATGTAVLSTMPVNEPRGIMGFVLSLPKWLLNLKNFVLVMLAVLLLSGLIKVIHYVVNRIY